MADLSVLDLIKQICECHVGPVQRAHRAQPTVSRTNALRRMKKKAFDALFTYLNNREIESCQNPWGVNTGTESVLSEVHALHSQRRHRDAARLEKLLDNLPGDKYDDFLKFLVALKGNSKTEPHTLLGNGAFGSISILSDADATTNKHKRISLSSERLHDAEHNTLACQKSFKYSHYPREMFETLFASIEARHERDLNIAFQMAPGHDLGGSSFFSPKLTVDNQYEKQNHNSLFGGLVQGKVNINSFLDFPDLDQSPNMRIPEFKTKKSISLSQLSDESGLGSDNASMSSSVITLSDQAEGRDPTFWLDAIDTPRSYHYTWEWIGYAPGPTEKPYLTEAGSDVYELLVRHRRKVVSLVCSVVSQPPPDALVAVCPEEITANVLLMLTGVPSQYFTLDPVTVSFQVCENIHVPGMSPGMMVDFLKDFTDCGTYYARLKIFSKAPVLDSFYTGGLCYEAFAFAIQKALSQFAAVVLNTPSTVRFIQLKTYLHRAMEQVAYLAVLCRCRDEPPRPPWSAEKTSDFPTGMSLLSYVYEEAEVAINSAHYTLLLSILQTTCSPFVLFVRDWIFYGVLRDSYEEFMIKMDTSSLTCRDEKYWSQAYTLLTQAPVPHFLQGIVGDIVTCGKSINLLRLCNREHFLCNISEREVPSMYITYSKEVLQAVETDCQRYVGRMRQTALKLSDDRAEMLRKAEAAKLELQQTARRVADEELARLQRIIDARKEEEQTKKRAEFSRLKQQMEDDKRRRAGEVQAERDEDERLMARITREEEALSVEEVELERRAREELIEYYTGLGEEAARRERLALWKVQRARRAMQREDFLEKDAQKWTRELVQLQHSLDKTSSASQGIERRLPNITEVEQSVQEDIEAHNFAQSGDTIIRSEKLEEGDGFDGVDSVDFSFSDVYLPRWAERHGGGDAESPLEVPGYDEVALPVWAAQELPTVIEEDDDSESAVQLPSWVLRAAAEDGGEEESVKTVDNASDDGEISLEDQPVEVKSDGIDNDEKESHTLSVDSETREMQIDHSKEGESSGLGSVSKSRELRAVQIGGSPLPKPHIKTSWKAHFSNETQEAETKPSARLVEGKLITDESCEPAAARSNIKLVPGSNLYTETEEGDHRPHIKASAAMTASTESELSQENIAPRRKLIDGADVNKQSSEERELMPRRVKQDGQASISTESLPKVWVIKKPSMFGHASQLSASEYTLAVPRLKKQSLHHANRESDFKDFGIKPVIRMNKHMSATKQSVGLTKPVDGGENYKSMSNRPHIRMIAGRNSTMESQQVNEVQYSRRRFLARNAQGHSSDSSVQRLLYGAPSGTASSKDNVDGPIPKIAFASPLEHRPECLQSSFSEICDDLNIDLMSNTMVVDLGRDLVDSAIASEEDVETYKYTPLSVLLARSLTSPIKAQISLVNSAIVTYFTSELLIDYHFVAIRRYLLMADGDFSEILANILFEKLSTNPLPQEIFNPLFLNETLAKAMRSSIHSDDKYMENLSFALTNMPSVLLPNAQDSLTCLELRYMVQWPLNIILTDKCMRRYYTIFGFLLQIKRVVWNLKDVWHRLTRDAIVVRGLANSAQFRHFQLYRQEMQHFVKAMQGYITSQVIHVSWQEFQQELSQPAAGLLDLQARHKQYVDKALAKCLLDKKAAKVMKVIQDILKLILKFRSQLVSANWQVDTSGQVAHPNFEAIKQTHNSFHAYSFFFFKFVHRLSLKGYQPYLQELLLQLNFNDFYKEAAT